MAMRVLSLVGLCLFFVACQLTESQTPIVVFAASSLTDAFIAIETAYESANPNQDVIINFAGSQILRSQLELGGSADVFAPADAIYLNTLIDEATRLKIAQNEMVIVVPTANPASIISFADLAQVDLQLVLAGEDVPAGRYARQIVSDLASHPDAPPNFAEAVLGNVVSAETNIRQALTKVRLGEADAAIVYRSDVTPDVKMIPLPQGFNVTVVYEVGVPFSAENPTGGSQFIQFVRSPAGQTILAEWGLQPLEQ